MSVSTFLPDRDSSCFPQLVQAISLDEKSITSENDSDVQEGGLRGWCIVLGAFLVQFCGFGYTDSFGVYQDYYTRIYITNQSASAISWIGATNAFLVTAGGLVAGILYDQGYFYHLLYGGSFLISFSLWMLSFAQPNHLYQNLLAQGIGLGLGGGMMFVPSVAVLSLYFKKKRTLVMVFASVGSSLGAVVHPIILNYLFSSPLGFSGTTRVSAGLVTFALLLVCMLIRPKLPPPVKQPQIMPVIQKLYKDRAFAAVSFGNAFFAVGFWFPLFYLQLDATKHGIGKHLTFYALVILNGSSLVGRLCSSFFSHSFGVWSMLVAASFCCSILIFSMVGLTNVPSLVITAVLYGYFSGIYLTLQAPIIAVLTTDMSELGTRLGIGFTFSGPPIHGSLLSGDFIWWRPAVLGGISAFVGTSLYAALPLIKRNVG